MRSVPQPYAKRTISIRNGEWSRHASIIKGIKYWEVELLQLYWNYREELVKEIAHISFSNLTQLWLMANNIQSIEAIVWMQMPEIRELRLDLNQIISVRGIDKAVFPVLTTLNLCRNYIKDAKHLTKGHFSCLEKLWICSLHEKKQFSDPFFSAKLETQSLNTISIQSDNLTIERSIKGVLEKKWKNVIMQ